MDTFRCLIAAAVGLSLLGCGTQAKDAAQIEKEVLLERSESWDGTPYKAYPSGPPQLTLIRLKIPARTQLPWYTHPMPNVAYVLSGELMVETRSGHQTRLKPGEVLPELVNIPHRGTSGNSPVELIVFYAGAPGLPLSKPD